MAAFQIDCIDPGSGMRYTFTVDAESREAAMNATRAAGHALAPDPAQRDEVDVRIRHVRETLDAGIRQRDTEARVKRHHPAQPPAQVEPPAPEPSHPESTAGRSLLVTLVAVVVVVVTVIFVGYIVYRVVRFHNTGR